MLMALGIVTPANVQLSHFVGQPPDGYATAVTLPSPPLLRGNCFTASEDEEGASVIPAKAGIWRLDVF